LLGASKLSSKNANALYNLLLLPVVVDSLLEIRLKHFDIDLKVLVVEGNISLGFKWHKIHNITISRDQMAQNPQYNAVIQQQQKPNPQQVVAQQMLSQQYAQIQQPQKSSQQPQKQQP